MFLIGRVWDAPIRIVNDITGGRISSLFGVADEPKLPKLDDDPEYRLPAKENDRLDVLLLGIRGKDDPENGGYLTDTILLLSVDEKTGDASLVSIPRDLTVRITDTVTDRINTAYLRLGVNGVKRLFSRVTGVWVDHAVVLDFTAFASIVDELGGITITLDKPFTESQQWAGEDGYEFSLPAGENTLNGEQALYYVRSRYSTSDFDRAWRQQQVILAVKDKLTVSGLISDPIAAMGIITTLNKHVETDLDILDAGTIKRLADLGRNGGNIRRYVPTTENLLYDKIEDGAYHLLPRGDTLDHLKEFIGRLPGAASIPVITTPEPGVTDEP